MESHLSALFENAGLIRNGKPALKNIRYAKLNHIIDITSVRLRLK